MVDPFSFQNDNFPNEEEDSKDQFLDQVQNSVAKDRTS